MAYQDHDDYQDVAHNDFSDHSDGWENSFTDHSDLGHGDSAHSDIAHADGYAGPSAHTFQDFSGISPGHYYHKDSDAEDAFCLTLPDAPSHYDESGYVNMGYPETWVGSCSSNIHQDFGNLDDYHTTCLPPIYWDYNDHGDYNDHSDVTHADAEHADSSHADFNDATHSGDHFDGTTHSDTGHEDALAHNDVAVPPAPTNLSAAAVM